MGQWLKEPGEGDFVSGFFVKQLHELWFFLTPLFILPVPLWMQRLGCAEVVMLLGVACSEVESVLSVPYDALPWFKNV